MIKAVFFDLDGTLLPMNEQEFIKVYFDLLSQKASILCYEKDSIIKAIWSGTKCMYKNDGSKSNEQVFWDCFCSIYNKENANEEIKLFEKFYLNEFKETKNSCFENPLAKEIVRFCKDHFQYVILATNPIFPQVGTQTRMSFVDLKEEDFDFVTYYENSSFCKPNPKYFTYLLNKFNLKPEEVIMFGNNEIEDGWCAQSIGIKTYMVGNHIIKDPNNQIQLPHLNMDEVISLLKKIKEEN